MNKNILRLFCLGCFVGSAVAVLADSSPLSLTTPKTYILPAGFAVNLRVIADGNPAPQYYWLSNGVPIPGALGSNLTVTATAATANVNYSAVATNIWGNSTNGPYLLRLTNGISSRPWGDVLLNSNVSVLDLLAIGDHIRGEPVVDR